MYSVICCCAISYFMLTEYLQVDQLLVYILPIILVLDVIENLGPNNSLVLFVVNGHLRNSMLLSFLIIAKSCYKSLHIVFILDQQANILRQNQL